MIIYIYTYFQYQHSYHLKDIHKLKIEVEHNLIIFNNIHFNICF